MGERHCSPLYIIEGSGKMKRINWNKYDRLLGTDADERIAKIIGCSKKTVYRRRHAMGIAPAHPEKDATGFWRRFEKIAPL